MGKTGWECGETDIDDRYVTHVQTVACATFKAHEFCLTVLHQTGLWIYILFVQQLLIQGIKC